MSDPSPPKPPPRRPPPPPSHTRSGAPRDRGAGSEALSQGDKDALSLRAIGLLNEQVQARIVHYKGDLETSPELDAITAQVVAQLKQMQAAFTSSGPTSEDPDVIEARHVATLTELLGRVCSDGERGNLIRQNLKPIGRRVAKLFFESELHEKTKGDKDKTIHYAEQGLYYVLSRYKNRIRTELEGFDYAGDDVKAATLELLAKTERDLQVAFLSRRSPELNRVMTIFTTVLIDFFQNHLPARLEQMAKLTIRNAHTARQPNSVGYKVLPDCFQAFRVEWERLLVQQMVNFCADQLVAALVPEGNDVHEETVRFFTDPHVYSETCEVVCNALYDFLCLEGFLDLPVDWRVKLSRAGADYGANPFG
ncbi:MAG TPA: hypothetical protein VH062_12880 [Polyangiaceae bacterium]|nr:hypothetical protein [Polyangiaceae bacterium]